MLNKAFLHKVSGYIAGRNLMPQGSKYIVALSGGADSVCLALTLRELGYDVEAAHCNFHLRGEESDRDETFCSRFCETNGIPLHITHFDTLGFAKMRKMSIEMAARHLRYAYFNDLKTSIGAYAICVAHHQDDSVETVIMNLIRGTGIHGLTGIKPRSGDIIRPLLCVTRKEIENVLDETGQPYVTDSTNLVDDVVRNKIRLDILPLMREINPSVSDSIAKTAVRVEEVVDVMDKLTVQAVSRVVESNGTVRIFTDKLLAEPAPEYVLFSLLKERGFTPAQTEQVYAALKSEPGRIFSSPTHQLLIDRNCLIIEPLEKSVRKNMVIPETGVYVYSEAFKFKVELVDCGKDFSLSKDPCCCYADASKVSFPLTVRPVAAGDRFVPFGMEGSRLVSDFLTDRKLNLFDKRRQLAVTDASGKIIWLVNMRPDNRCRITSSTATALKIIYLKQ